MPIFGQAVSRKWATSPTCGNDGGRVNITNESFYHRFTLPEERKNRPLTSLELVRRLPLVRLAQCREVRRAPSAG